MKNKTYDRARWGLQILIPALIFLTEGLGSIYGFDTTKLMQTLALLATFGGMVLGISSLNYKAKGGDYK